MPSRAFIRHAVFLGSVLTAPFQVLPAYSQQVWTGLTYSFTSTAAMPAEDTITSNVRFARATTAGIYNAVSEDFYSHFSSPASTLWATEYNNDPGADISATNWSELNFTDWQTAYGGTGSLASFITQSDAVVYLELDDVYLDLRFTEWGIGLGGGGSFSYMRAVAPSIETTGDYNSDGTVNAADYTVWRDTLGENVDPGTGADGEPDGTIDVADYNFWKSKFGNVIEGAGATSVAVPEPATTTFVLGGLFLLASCRRITPRGPGQDG